MAGLLRSTDIQIAQELMKDPVVQKGLEQTEITRFLNDNQLTLERAAARVSAIMDYGENDNVKLKAAEMTFRLHKFLDDKGNSSGDVDKRPIINFNFNDSQVNLQGLFCPTRE